MHLPTPPAQCDTRSIFSEVWVQSFPSPRAVANSSLNKLSRPYFLLDRGRIVGVKAFLRRLTLCKVKRVSWHLFVTLERRQIYFHVKDGRLLFTFLHTHVKYVDPTKLISNLKEACHSFKNVFFFTCFRHQRVIEIRIFFLIRSFNSLFPINLNFSSLWIIIYKQNIHTTFLTIKISLFWWGLPPSQVSNLFTVDSNL